MTSFGDSVRLSLDRMRGRRSWNGGLLDWCRRFLPEHTQREWSGLHRWVAAELDRASDVRGVKIGVLGPRGCAKSTLVTLAYVLRCACEGSDRYIWILSDTRTQAETHLSNVRAELLGNERLRSWYGLSNVGKGGTWSVSSVTLANGSVIEAFGAGQKLRGRRRRASRPTLVVCDDLENDASITSRVIRESVASWFRNSVLPAGRPWTNFVVLGTALHRDCLACSLMDSAGWRSRAFSAIEKWPDRRDLWDEWESLYCGSSDGPDRAHEYFIAREREMSDGSSVLWPDEEPLEHLMRLRVEGGRASFDREKQSNPVDPDRAEFPSEYFGDWLWCDGLPAGARIVSVDPSIGRESRQGDYASVVVATMTSDGVFWVDCSLGRGPADVLLSRVLRVVDERTLMVFAESNVFQELLGELLASALARAGCSAGVASVNNSVAKDLRIRRLGPWLSRRRLRVVKSDGGRALVDQLRDFPTGSYDDGPDAVEMALRGWESLCGNAGERVSGRV